MDYGREAHKAEGLPRFFTLRGSGRILTLSVVSTYSFLREVGLCWQQFWLCWS
jgi:hypothetical protein